jgi:hypothetical protein
MRDRIETFLRRAEAYLSWYKIERAQGELLAKAHDDEVDRFAAKLLEDNRRTNKARNDVLTAGRELAPRLEAAGDDCSALLFFLHAADGGGGPSVALPLWAPLKVALQRLTIREGLPPDKARTGHRQSEDIDVKARKATADKPRTKRERLREQRLAFCRTRRKKGETWGAIYAAYHKKFPNDKNADRHSLRTMYENWNRKGYFAE